MEELVLTVDAGSGFGWRLDGINRTEGVTEESRLVAAEWVDHEDMEWWQCWKELVAVERAVFAEASKLKGKMVLVRADAVTTVRYVNKGSGSSVFLSAVVRRIWDLCIQHGIALVAEHIPGV